MRREVRDGVRDPALVRQQYEDYWGDVLRLVQQAVAAEPADLARAVNLCIAEHARRPRKQRWLRGRRTAALLAGRPLPPSLSPRGIDMIMRTAIADLVAGYCDDGTRRIIELGSGWGTNLFYLWLGGGPRSADYVAMEYTEAGREATRLLASTEPNISVLARAFDYNAPDLSEFRSPDRTVVLTSFSIEQMTRLNDSLFEELLAIPGLDRVIHVEPVGWQMSQQGPWAPLMQALTFVMPPRLSVDIDMRRRSRSSGYNRDLVARLHALEQAGRIRIERTLKHYAGPNPINPGSAIVWRRA